VGDDLPQRLVAIEGGSGRQDRAECCGTGCRGQANEKCHVPARRVGQPEDVANAVLILATRLVATGSAVRADGGGAIA
jgi:NAD(P)-dependent dehydrogenase (short-subunit alcohol dehydrogenase family)